MSYLRVSIIQSDIKWEDKEYNLNYFRSLISSLKDKTDLVILPETFSTGFSMNVSFLAETTEEDTILSIQKWAEDFNFAIAGSFISKDSNSKFYNRGFFITPNEKYFYDKRHLFRMGQEHDVFSSGDNYSIILYKDWNIRLIICYDLRFPVWCRNKNNEYDLLINVANWPKPRTKVWTTLLQARAIENQAYVCGANRIGEDKSGIAHQGDSMIVNYYGNILEQAETNTEIILTATLNKDDLLDFRKKFPAWKDADNFEIK